MTTDLFFVTESGNKVRWFWTRQQAESHVAALRGVMPRAHWMILTGEECRVLGIR